MGQSILSMLPGGEWPDYYRYRKEFLRRLKFVRDTWLNELCPLARGTTVYYDPVGGSDAGAGTIGSPFKTFGKIQGLIDAAGTNVNTAYLMKAGVVGDADPTTFTTGILRSKGKDNITFGVYGTGSSALINCFSKKYTSGWTQVGSTNRWTRTETDTIAAVRWDVIRMGGALWTLTECTTTTLCENNPVSYHFTAGTLSINLGTGNNPNSFTLEAVKANDTYGVVIEEGSDGCRVDRLVVHGAGDNPSNVASNICGMADNLTGTDMVAFTRTGSGFSGSHAHVHVTSGPGKTGGIFLWEGCRAYYTRYNGGAGETIFNDYTHTALQEGLVLFNEPTYGTRPHTSWYNATTNPVRGQGFYGHTSAGETGTYVAFGNRIPANPFGCSGQITRGNTPAIDQTNHRSAIVFIIGNDFEPRRGSVFSIASGAIIDSNRYPAQQPDTSSGLFNQAAPFGWFTNNLVEEDGSMQTSGVFLRSLWGWSGQHATWKMWHNHFRIINNGQRGPYVLDFNGTSAAGSSDQVEAVNNIFSNESATDPSSVAQVTLGGLTGDFATRVRNNAFYRYLSTTSHGGYGGSANKVELNYPPLPWVLLMPDSPLIGAGDASTPIGSTTIGPVWNILDDWREILLETQYGANQVRISGSGVVIQAA